LMKALIFLLNRGASRERNDRDREKKYSHWD
jgi:hypothetical protein